LLTADDTVKITDFGISYMFNENQDDTINDKNASPLFCPPEACSCKYYLKILKLLKKVYEITYK